MSSVLALGSIKLNFMNRFKSFTIKTVQYQHANVLHLRREDTLVNFLLFHKCHIFFGTTPKFTLHTKGPKTSLKVNSKHNGFKLAELWIKCKQLTP